MAKWKTDVYSYGLVSQDPVKEELVIEADLIDTDGENAIFFNIDSNTGYETVTAIHSVGRGWTKVKE